MSIRFFERGEALEAIQKFEATGSLPRVVNLLRGAMIDIDMLTEEAREANEEADRLRSKLDEIEKKLEGIS